MALVVNNNIPALQTYNAVNATTNSLQKSIQKLSSGLRINSAADDAAGLAISEKMRAQVRGLDRAISNSQDGISMIQTAEGALSETHSILQRMRELSVQAANDTLTQQDRGYIQLEIDQLREEVTRIGNTTQFNKKKLLDGSAAALWSAGDLETKAFIKGGLRTIDQFGQKSAAEGNYRINVKALNGNGEVKKTDIFKIKHGASESLTLDATGHAGVDAITATNVPEGEYMFASSAPGTTPSVPTLTANGTYTAGGVAVATVFTAASAHSNIGGSSLLIEVVDGTAGATKYKVTGQVVWKDGSSKSVDFTTASTGADVLLETYDSALAGLAIDYDAGHNTGARSVVALKGGVVSASDAGSITITEGTHAFSYAVSDQAKGKTVDYTIHKLNATTGAYETGTFTFAFNAADDLADDSALVDYTAMNGGVAATVYKSSGLSVGTIANSNTKLYDIDKFWNSEGRFLLKDPQTLTITQGDGKQASITLYQNDTVGSLVQKLNEAIGGIGTGLGQEKYATNNTFAEFVPVSSKTGGAETTAGTIVIRSAVTGDAGKLSFAGDEDVIKALSMNVLKDAKESDYNVTIADAHTNVTVASGQVTGNKLISMVHENVDVVFESMLGIRAGSVGADGYFTYTYDSTDGKDIYLHLADNTTVFQIGANEGEDMGINVGDMRAEALGLDKVLVTDRESAARSITIIDAAIDKVSTQRAKIGAYQNRLEHTITNLTIAGENLTAAESRIRDTDMAKEMMNFTKLQIMLQAGTSMLAQANALPQNVLSLIR